MSRRKYIKRWSPFALAPGMNPKQHNPKQVHLPSVFPCLSSYLIVWFQAVTYVLGSVRVHPEQTSYIHRQQRRWKVRLPLLVSFTSLLFLVQETTETEFCWPLVLIGFVQEQIQHERKKQNKIFRPEPWGVCVYSQTTIKCEEQKSFQNLLISVLKMTASLTISS